MFQELKKNARATLDRFVQSEEGASAVEFAIVAIPFFWLVFVIFELCLIYLVSVMFDYSLGVAQREIEVGQAQIAGWSQTDLQNQICQNTVGLLTCANIRIFSDIQGDCASLTVPTTFAGIGGSNECVLFRVEYSWPLIIPSFTGQLSGSNGSAYEVIVQRVVMIEAF